MKHGLRPFVYVMVLTLLLGLLSACNPSGEVTPTLQGAFVPTRVSPTPRPTETATLTPSETLPPTATFTATDLPTSTATATATATETTAATATWTITPTVPTATPTATLTSTTAPEPSPTFESGLPPETPVEGTPEVSGTPILYGETVRGTINNDQPRALYSFTGNAGEIVNIRMTAPNGDLDPYLKLLEENGLILEENDDYSSETGRDSLISNFVLPITGNYTIMATRFDEERGIRVGDFELTLTTGTYVIPPSTDAIIPISYGETVTGEITDETSVVYYSFTGTAGDVVTIELLSEDNLLDPLVILLDMNNVSLIENDDSPERDLDSLIEGFVLPADGIYMIAATRYEGLSGNTTGTYTLTLAQGTGGIETAALTPELTPITPGEPVIPEVASALTLGQPVSGALTPDVNMVVYSFEGAEGQHVSFSARRLSGLFDPSLLIVGPDGREIAHNDDTSRLNRDATVDNLLLPSAGQYRVVVMRSRWRAGTGQGEFEVLVSEGTAETSASAIIPVEMPPDTPIQLPLSRPEAEASAGFYGFPGETIQLQLQSEGNLAITGVVLYTLTNEVIWQGSEATADITLPYDGHYGLIVYARRGQGTVTASFTRPE